MLDFFSQEFVFGQVATMEAAMVMVTAAAAITITVMAIAVATAAVAAVTTVAGMRSVVAALAVRQQVDLDDDLGGSLQKQFLVQEPSGYRTTRCRNERPDA